MSSASQNLSVLTDDEQDLYLSLYSGRGFAVYAVFVAAMELNLFEIISKVGPHHDAEISAADIASHLPTKNGGGEAILERMLQFLASHSILKCTLVKDGDDDIGHVTRLYSLTSMSKLFVPDEEGISMAPSRSLSKANLTRNRWNCLKDAVLEGEVPTVPNLFECLAKNEKMNIEFNEAMSSRTSILMREILDTYDGFKDLKEIVDVGGGLGLTSKIIISKYPWIHGINFDLPQVIKYAPSYPGIKHIEGDMFQSVPKAEAILLKHVLHDWKDEECVKILKNCRDALAAEYGKVIIIDIMLPESPETDLSSKTGFMSDMIIMLATPQGKERTEKEFHSLANAAGFAHSKLISRNVQFGVLEFYKNNNN